VNRLKEDPLQGALFVSSNRSRLKMLFWDGTGLWVLVKRLKKGADSFDGGVEMRGARFRAWYER
jgi:transposase